MLPLQPPFPVLHSTQSCWRGDPSQLDNHQSGPGLPASCDILIIGGGYAGVATAYHVLASCSEARKPSVVLLEARGACSGATGRNGGHLRPDITSAPVRLLQRYGAEAAAAVAQFEMDHLVAIAQLLGEADMDCEFTEAASYEVFTTSEQVAAAKERYDTLRAEPAFAKLLSGVEFHAGDDAPDRTGIKDAQAFFSSPAAHLSPYKLTIGLLSLALEMGLYAKTHTPVLSIHHDNQYRVATRHGEMTAANIVLATNAYTPALLPEYAGAIVPCKGLACRISASSSASLLPRLPTSSLCARVQENGLAGYNYIIQRTDSSVVVGGAHHTYKQDRPSWYNNVDDRSLIGPARDYYSASPGFAARAFVGWDHVSTKVDHVWTGVMGYSADSLPHVGLVPGHGEGMFILAGFNGHGMPVAYLAAKGIADMVGEGRKTYEQTGLPAVYKASRERLAPRFDDVLGRELPVKQ